MTGFIGLHIGAGSHSNNLKSHYETLCETACRKAVDKLKRGESAVDVACFVTTILEDSELTNAGIGSNLTWDGTVECDASVMDGTSLNFGAVGALECVKNPIMVARKILDNQSHALTLQRVSPCLMVGEGARKVAEQAGLTVSSNILLTDKMLRLHRKYRRKVENLENGCVKEVSSRRRLDTVGAVCVDVSGNLAATCTSGGIALKQPGRVGQAAVFGAGCWAQSTGLSKGVATSVSGTGEDLIKTLLAKEVAIAISKSDLPSNAVYTAIKSSFLESPFLMLNSEKLCGLIALEACKNNGEFIWAHTTSTMGISYMSTKHKNPKVRISKLPEGKLAGSTITMEGISW